MVIIILTPALISLILSLGLLFSGVPDAGFWSLYVGLWVPSILAFGALLSSADKPCPPTMKKKD